MRAGEDGSWDPEALGYDAYNGKLLWEPHRLARAYEDTIANLRKENDRKDAELRKLRAELAGDTSANAQQQPPPADATDASKSQKKAADVAGRSTHYARTARAFSWLGSISALLGGPVQLTSFLILVLKDKYRGNKGAVVDAIPRMLDDDVLRKKIENEQNKRRKCRIGQFMFAKIEWLTYASMDRLRFAMPWCPGHATLAKYMQTFLDALLKNWVPAGPTAGAGMTQMSEEEQTAAAEADSNGGDGMPTEADVQQEAEEALSSAAPGGGMMDSGVDVVETQALALLALEFPDMSEEALREKWSQGGNGIYDGHVLHVIVVRESDGVLLGFVKALRCTTEVFVDEVLVTEDARGKRLAQHMLRAAMEACPAQRYSRLQVKGDESKAPARKVYRQVCYNQTKPRGAPWDSPLDGCVMMGATRAAVVRGTTAMVANTPLGQGLCIKVCWAGETSETDADADMEDAGGESETDADADMEDAGGEAAEAGARAADNHPSSRQAQGEDADRSNSAAAGAGAGEVANARGGGKGGGHGCDEREMREDECADTADDKGKPDPSHGARSLADVLTLMLVCLWADNIILTGGVACHVGYKLTCDAARLMNAPRAWQVMTTVIAQLLCAGAKPGTWVGAVKYMAQDAQSCRRAFAIRTWFGKDSRKNVRNHPTVNHQSVINQSEMTDTH